MRSLAFGPLTALLGALAAACAPPSSVPPPVTALPAMDLVRLDGQSTSLQSALAGSVAVIDLWATWCTACERERPKLARLHAALSARGLRVVGLDVGESPGTVNAYLAEKPAVYPIYLDPDFHLTDALGDKQLPSILVVDRAGRVVHRSSSLDQATLDQVKSLLATPAE